jgi:hypothetical protein
VGGYLLMLLLEVEEGVNIAVVAVEEGVVCAMYCNHCI